jgi:Holliday junction resolvase RusA-like endonuclease
VLPFCSSSDHCLGPMPEGLFWSHEVLFHWPRVQRWWFSIVCWCKLADEGVILSNEHISKDLDNLLKFVLGALQAAFYFNNKFFYDIHVQKIPVFHLGDKETLVEVKALLKMPAAW